MTGKHAFAGVLAPVLTPFADDFSPAAGPFVAHCRDLLDQGANGLAIFGTTSEANSLSLEEKLVLLDRLVEAGIDPALLMPGTGACALPDTLRLTRAAVDHGCGGVLLLPPFYYKGVSDDGLFASTARLIEGIGDRRLKIYLYHIPPVAQVGWALPLIERLVEAYPDTVVGIKDSSGDWANTEAVLEALPGFGVFVGSESFLLQNLQAGGVGCITATANVNVGAIRGLYDNWQGEDAAQLNEGVVALRQTIQSYQVIPALKEIVAQRTGDPGWRRLRPPLAALAADQAAALTDDLRRHAFALAAE